MSIGLDLDSTSVLIWVQTVCKGFQQMTKLDATVKSVLNSHSKIDKTKVLTANASLIKVKSIADCSLGAFCITFDLH